MVSWARPVSYGRPALADYPTLIACMLGRYVCSTTAVNLSYKYNLP